MTQPLITRHDDEEEKGQHPRPQFVVVPPINFAMVAPGIYRSGHPNKKNSGFLRGLDLKGIMYVFIICSNRTM